MSANFLTPAMWNASHEAVVFLAQVEGRTVECHVAWEVLVDDYRCGRSEPIACFLSNRAAIEARMAQRIARRLYEPDGTVALRAHHVPSLMPWVAAANAQRLPGNAVTR